MMVVKASAKSHRNELGLRNCIKHVKRKKDRFHASHRVVAEIQGEPNIYDPCTASFCLGGNN